MASVVPTQPLSARYRAEFPVFQRSSYLNTCSLGALSARSRERVGAYLDLWETRGAPAWYDTWLPACQDLRAAYGRLIGANAEDIALHPSISSGVASIASSLDHRRRPRIVTTSLDFPTVAYQWLGRAADGLMVEIVESPDGISVPLELMAKVIDERTALVATSQVFFTSGAIQDVGGLAEICHSRGALLLVDGYQAAGQLPVDAPALGVDFYCAGGLKWLLGGSGIAFLYANPERTTGLQPRAAGWFGHLQPFEFDPRHLELRRDARRFETGTPSMASVCAQLGGLQLIEEIGVPAIRASTMGLTEDLIERAREAGLRPKVASRAEDRTGIVMIPRENPRQDVARLAAAGIISDARPGHVRISPYFYNVRDDHLAALEELTRD
jgi:kynureninase